MKTLVIANQKGGVGKSALVGQFALYAGKSGLKVLVVDLDHQANTTNALRRNPIVKVLEQASSTLISNSDSVLSPPNVAVALVGADDSLGGLERRSEHHNRFATTFRRVIETASGFDLCVIDTNPNPDIRYACALVTADYVLSPIQLTQEALDGIGGVLNHPRYGLARVRETLNPKLVFLGLLPNLFEKTPFQRRNLELILSRYGNRLLTDDRCQPPQPLALPTRTAIAEAQAAGLFVGEMTKSSARDAWREMKPIFDTLLYRMGLSAPSRFPR
ncbi:ParA family protein [Asticcacaulis sp. W401b]|uniref:ParA family protein n=1 Tax=Asticcacaulis sp. W401b TaxID=3388666 RepID=UPI003970ACA3